MFHRLLPAASITDRWSQGHYRKLTKLLLTKSGVTVSGLPLWISATTFFDLSGKGSIELGNECVVSHGVRILTHDFSLDRAAERHLGRRDDNLEYVRRSFVRIGAHAFIGMNSIILPGVTVGDGAIVGAGSVVTKDVPDDVVVAGNPAKVITTTREYLDRKIDDFVLVPRRR